LIVAVFVEISISYVYPETVTTYSPARLAFPVFAAAGMLTWLENISEKEVGDKYELTFNTCDYELNTL
jgi:hypothetical protein